MLTVKEDTTAPSTLSGYGKIYIDSVDHKAYLKASDGTTYDLTATGGGGSSFYQTLQDAGVALTQRAIANFIDGDGITVVMTDNVTKTDIRLNVVAILKQIVDIVGWTKGDILVYNGTTLTRFPAGANNDYIAYDSTTATGLKTVTPTSSGASYFNWKNTR